MYVQDWLSVVYNVEQHSYNVTIGNMINLKSPYVFKTYHYRELIEKFIHSKILYVDIYNNDFYFYLDIETIDKTS